MDFRSMALMGMTMIIGIGTEMAVFVDRPIHVYARARDDVGNERRSWPPLLYFPFLFRKHGGFVAIPARPFPDLRRGNRIGFQVFAPQQIPSSSWLGSHGDR
jgi:hypothetical protein